MSFQEFKSKRYCVGGRRRSSRVKICGDITSKCSKVIIGFSFCHTKESMTVSDNTIQGVGLGDFFEKLGKKGLNVSKIRLKTS